MKDISPELARSLLTRIAAHDEGGLRELNRLLGRRIFAFAINRMHDPDEAETVVTDTLWEVWKQPERFDGSCKLSTWVLGIAHYKMLNVWRSRGVPTESLDDDAELVESDTLGPFDARLRDEEQAQVRRCIEGLSDAHREVLECVYFQDMSVLEAAAALGCPKGTVQTRLHHARHNLRKSLERALGAGARTLFTEESEALS